MKYSLSQPYPLNESIITRFINSFVFGIFVFLFLFIFQPFELSKLPHNILPIAIGYGAICFAIMAILNVIVFLSLPNVFSERTWTTKKEILWTIFNILVIGLGNYIYSYLIKIADFTWWNLFLFETYTLAVAIFPITISILLNQARLHNKFERQSKQLNQDIEKQHNISNAKPIPDTVTIDMGTEKFELAVENFLYAKSDDNYVELYYVSNSKVCRQVFRNTLKNVYSWFSEHNSIFKCHKSYIVNLTHVQRVSGNAQGYKLHLGGTDEILPVSRSLNNTIKLYFAGSH